MVSRTISLVPVAMALICCLYITVDAQTDSTGGRVTTNLLDDTRRESGNRFSNNRGDSSSSFAVSGQSGQDSVMRGETGTRPGSFGDSRRESSNRFSGNRGDSSASFAVSGKSGQDSVMRGETGTRPVSFGDSRRESSNRFSVNRGDSSASFAVSGQSGQDSVMRGETGTRPVSFGDSRRDSDDRLSINRGEFSTNSNSFGNSGRDPNMRGDRGSSSAVFGNTNRDSTFTGATGVSRPTQFNENLGSWDRINGEFRNDQRNEIVRGHPFTENNSFRNNRPGPDQSRAIDSFYEKPRGPYAYRTMYNYHREYPYNFRGGYGRGPYRPSGFYGGYPRFRRSSGGDPEGHFFYAQNWNVQ